MWTCQKMLFSSCAQSFDSDCESFGEVIIHRLNFYRTQEFSRLLHLILKKTRCCFVKLVTYQFVYFGSEIKIENSLYFGREIEVETCLYFGSEIKVENSLYFGSGIRVGSNIPR